MDPTFHEFLGSFNGFQLGNQTVFPDKNVDNGPIYENNYLGNNRGNEPTRYGSTYNGEIDILEKNFLDHTFGGIQFLPMNPSPSITYPSSSASVDEDLHEDCDLNDTILGYIAQVLMEEDMEEQNSMLQESLDLQAAEKSFYDVLGKKYPPSPESGLTHVDYLRDSPDGCSSGNHDPSVRSGAYGNGSGYLFDPNWSTSRLNCSNGHEQGLISFNAFSSSVTSVSSSGNIVADRFIDSPISPLQAIDLCNDTQMMWQFRKGIEEANKFLPNGNKLLSSEAEINVEKKDDEKASKVRKSLHGEDINEVEERTTKQAAIYPEPTLRTEEFDNILLCSQGKGEMALSNFRKALREEKIKSLLQTVDQKGQTRGKVRGKRQKKKKKEVIDLRTLLISCAQAVAADDRRSANDLLKQIRQHSSPFGDGNQRLANCFADGLEARLAGTGSQIHKALVNKKATAADFIKAYHLYLASCPFQKISNFASNRTILDTAENAPRIHIIDFGILYGFQWPTFLQRVSQREGGPPRLRITGVEFPQPGFRPAQRIEETGRRLAAYARHFNVPFEYNAIAKKWENVKVEDLKIEKGEFLAVNCLYRSKNLLDETVLVDSSRNIFLNLVRKINPNLFIHGVVNGSYNAPFFVTRFREALFHFSALFDMLEASISRERYERMLIERDLFGREALNVIACEGWERVERPETYKQWSVRNLRSGFVQVPFSRWIMKRAAEKVKLYHKDFVIDEESHWLLQGWKGRIIYAISCWKPALAKLQLQNSNY